jgi:hypothetical protein
MQLLMLALAWDQSIKGGHCGNQVKSYIITGALNICTGMHTLLELGHNLTLASRCNGSYTSSAGYMELADTTPE